MFVIESPSQETCTAIQGFGKKIDKSIYQGFQWLLNGMADDWEKLSRRVDKDFAEQKEAARKYKRERLEQIRKQKEERYVWNSHLKVQLNSELQEDLHRPMSIQGRTIRLSTFFRILRANIILTQDPEIGRQAS